MESGSHPLSPFSDGKVQRGRGPVQGHLASTDDVGLDPSLSNGRLLAASPCTIPILSLRPQKAVFNGHSVSASWRSDKSLIGRTLKGGNTLGSRSQGTKTYAASVGNTLSLGHLNEPLSLLGTLGNCHVWQVEARQDLTRKPKKQQKQIPKELGSESPFVGLLGPGLLNYF